MKRLLILSLMLLCLSALYAGDGDHILTREEPSNLLIDAGLAVASPMASEDLRAGIFAGVTFTPAVFRSLAIGVKLQFSATANPSELRQREEGFLKTLDMAASGLLCAKYAWAKSFELYGAFGARYDIYDFVDFSNLGQRWGLIVQGGVHGRQTDRFGVGAEIEYYKTITKGADDELGIRAYISYEI